MTNYTAKSSIIKGLVSLGIGVAGLIYILKMPPVEPKYAPTEVKTGKYILVDVNSDKKVDVIKVNGIVKYRDESKEMNRIFDEISDYRFLGFHHNLSSITPEIQETADSVFKGYLNEKNLERIILKKK